MIIYMISVMLLFFRERKKTSLNIHSDWALRGDLGWLGVRIKNNAKLRDDIYFVVKVWKSIPASEYLIICGEKGGYLQRNTTKAPISRCFCS